MASAPPPQGNDAPPSYEDTTANKETSHLTRKQTAGYQGQAPAGYAGGYQSTAPAGAYNHGYNGPPGYQPVGQQPSYMGQPGTVIVAQQPSVVVVGGCPACRVGVLEDDFTCLGVCCAIFFFPLGLIFCLLMRQRRCPNCGAVFG